jgi:Bacteriophage baseplate protein W
VPTIYALHVPIAIDAGLGQLQVQRDWNRYVDQLVRQVLLTAKGQRVNRPDFGAGLRSLLFEPVSEATKTMLRATVLEALRQWLDPVLTVEAVDVEVVETTVEVTVAYRVKGEGSKQLSRVEVSAL